MTPTLVKITTKFYTHDFTLPFEEARKTTFNKKAVVPDCPNKIWESIITAEVAFIIFSPIAALFWLPALICPLVGIAAVIVTCKTTNLPV